MLGREGGEPSNPVKLVHADVGSVHGDDRVFSRMKRPAQAKAPSWCKADRGVAIALVWSERAHEAMRSLAGGGFDFLVGDVGASVK